MNTSLLRSLPNAPNYSMHTMRTGKCVARSSVALCLLMGRGHGARRGCRNVQGVGRLIFSCVVAFPKVHRTEWSITKTLSFSVSPDVHGPWAVSCSQDVRREHLSSVIHPPTATPSRSSNQTIDQSRLTSLIHNITLLQFIVIITKLPGKAMPEWSAYGGGGTTIEIHVFFLPAADCFRVVEGRGSQTYHPSNLI